MKKDLFKINGYIFGNTDFIQDRLFNFIQEKGLYFVGTVSDKNDLGIEIQNTLLKVNGYIFSDNRPIGKIKDDFSFLLKEHNYYFVGISYIEYDEIKLKEDK